MEKNNDIKLDKSLFVFETERNDDVETVQGSSLSFWKDAQLRFKKNAAAKTSVVVFLIILVIALAAPFLGAYHNKVEDSSGNLDGNMIGAYQNADYKYLPPKIPVIEKLGIFNGKKDGVDVYAQKKVPEDVYFFFGTDNFGRDLFVRTMVGALISIVFGLAAALIDLVVGVTLGGISGYYGGKVDLVLQRIVEIMGSIPTLIWVILIILYLGSGIFQLLGAMMIAGWIPMYRIVRAQVFKLKEQEFVLSSLTLGGSGLWIIRKHILPNAIGVIIIWLMFTIPSAIFFESFLSFLGMGISVPIPSLGSLANAGRADLNTNAYVLFIPALVLSMIMLSFNLIADGLRDAFDPKMRGGE